MILENIKVTTTSNSLDAKVIDKKIGFVSGGEYQKGSAWMEYDDLTLVLLSAKGEVITTKTIDKVRKRFALPNGWGISNGNILIYHLAEQKYFDYQLTQSSLDDSKIFIYYNDLDKEKNTKKILILDTNLNEITTDEISENPKANISTRAFPGSKGYIRVEVKDLKIRDQIKNFKNQTIEPINY